MTLSFSTVAIAVTTTRLYAFVPFPFCTKNEGYSVDVTSAGSVVNVDTPTVIINSKRNIGVLMFLDFPSGGLSNQCYLWNGASITVTFA